MVKGKLKDRIPLTIRIDTQLYNAIERFCNENNILRSDFINEALKALLLNARVSRELRGYVTITAESLRINVKIPRKRLKEIREK
jgi:metal-responsive CopG/Arc/MetJ family transcriptional regulator